MARKEIAWRDQAKAQLRAIDQPNALRILNALADFAATGEGDVKRLQDVEPPEMRLRVGDYRLRFHNYSHTLYVTAVKLVHCFDVDDPGDPLWGMEDFCALLGLRPTAKYETTWERIARAVRDHVPSGQQYETFRRLAATLLLTYALRNADCHAKNLALLYTTGNDVHLSPAYDFLTTTVYASYQYNPPGIGFMGKKT